ncbi:MAG: hypothetical protein P1P63_03490 [Treponemataceae bacterium]
MKKIFAVLVLLVLSVALFAVQLSDLFIMADDGTFLGTFENKYATKSIFNKYSDYGSKYATESIFNKYGDYGSNYSEYSPFNKYASQAPWLYDFNGNCYGRLSVNKCANGVTNDSYDLACKLKALRDSM